MAEDYGTTQLVADLRKNFHAGVLHSYKARRQQLLQFQKMITESGDEFYKAVYKDLKKCKAEADIMEVMQVKIELGHALENLSEWMKPEKRKPDLINITNYPEISSDPLGVTLIVGAWNYPIHLLLMPLVGAIAAGNCVVLKPSELSPHTANCMETLISKYFDPKCVRVVNGGIPETQALLKQRFDLIFYTGGTTVGKIYMKAAAEFLTPVVLELGGKCPAIIDSTCDFDVIAQRIVWAKYCNAGQTCLAADYIICVGPLQEKVIASLIKAIELFYGKDQKKSDSYGRIVNSRHFERLSKLIIPDKVAYGNICDAKDLYISPTILAQVSPNDSIMKEEIFGPILPILTVDSVDEAIQFVNEREKPLALYAFSKKNKVLQKIRDRTSSGGFCANDALVHAAIPSLPFGGVGYSGVGSYHGKQSFDCFSHKKSCLFKNQQLEVINKVRYPPYWEDWKLMKYLSYFLIPSGKEKSFLSSTWFIALMGIVCAVIYYAVHLSK